jgi:hypothetical protein
MKRDASSPFYIFNVKGHLPIKPLGMSCYPSASQSRQSLDMLVISRHYCVYTHQPLQLGHAATQLNLFRQT